MAVPAYDSSSGGVSSGFETTHSFPMTVGAGLSNSLLVFLTINQLGSTPSSVTWNGTAFTGVHLGGAFAADYYYLQNPAAGSFNVVANWGVTIAAGSVAVLITDAGIPDASATTSNKTNNVAGAISASVSVTKTNSLLLSWEQLDVGMGIVSQGAGQTQIYSAATDFGGRLVAASYKAGVATGSQSMSTNVDAGGTSGGINTVAVISIPPPSAGNLSNMFLVL